MLTHKYRLVATEKYLKLESIFVKKHKDIATVYHKTLRLLKENPLHPSLRLHKLHGNLSEYHSISINLDYRIIIDFVITKTDIVLLAIGTHKEYEKLARK